MNSWGGVVVETTSCLTIPGSERQARGVMVGVAGARLGVKVTVVVAVTATVAVEETTVWVGEMLFDGEQLESPARSAT